MTPRFDWTPVSEPPDTNRLVEVWIVGKSGAEYFGALRWHPEDRFFYGAPFSGNVTHWRDIDPPEEA